MNYEDEELLCIEALKALQRAYVRDSKPIIDRLCRIRAMRGPDPIIMAYQEANQPSHMNSGRQEDDRG